MSKKVLITGINGFAGTYMARLLAEAGFDVHGFVSDADKVPVRPGQTLHAVDLRQKDRVAEAVKAVGADYVVHLAAISFVAHGDVREIYETNIVGTRHLLEALSGQKKHARTLLVSSANVYGNALHEYVAEDDPVAPVNDYAVSKIAMEYMAPQFTDRLDIVVARPFNYTGRGQSLNFLVPKIVNHFRTRSPAIELGNTDISRDFSDVRAVVEYLYRLLMAENLNDRLFNICSGSAYSLNTIIEMCQDITKHRIDVRVNPAFVRANEIRSLAGNPARLHRAVGAVSGFGLYDTLQWMLLSSSE